MSKGTPQEQSVHSLAVHETCFTLFLAALLQDFSDLILLPWWQQPPWQQHLLFHPASETCFRSWKGSVWGTPSECIE